MILLIDNYDSFTHNLAQLAGQFADICILRNDAPELLRKAEEADGIIISPGPGKPEETGQVFSIIERFYKEKPILGICLGHQAIGAVFGGQVQQANRIYHGKASTVRQTAGYLFQQLPAAFEVIRYHSLVIKQQSVPEGFCITGYSEEDNEVMGVEHKKYPVFGLQFHPESIGTADGASMIQRFIQLCGGEKYERAI
ncbi:anthranilate synthase component II [Enterococcus sp. LJL51]|uniref:anthranilate synthase component II n=1 Tax=Enterococcus sp. LJL51 TaxID=3416656 RepID=UPI003CF5E692